MYFLSTASSHFFKTLIIIGIPAMSAITLLGNLDEFNLAGIAAMYFLGNSLIFNYSNLN